MADLIDITLRRQLVDDYWQSYEKTSWPIFQTLTEGQIGREYAKQDRLLDEYGEILPQVPVSRCPLCDAMASYVFDPAGLDGPWWAKGNLTDYAPADTCEHFRLLMGAVDFHGRLPSEAKVHREILPGPGVPFVIPRIAQIETMQMVVSCFTLPHNDTAYLTAYFSDEPVHSVYLHQPWGREAYQVVSLDGEYEGWSASGDAWDFDLQPWIDQGLLSWIVPGDTSYMLVREGDCPFVSCAGVRLPQKITRGVIEQLALPDGANPDLTD